MTTQENDIKKTYDKRFEKSLDFDFFKHPVYPSGFEEDSTITIELNSAKEVTLCTGDTKSIYKILDINLEYDGFFDISYATSIREIYSGRLSIPYTKVTSIHYQARCKKYIVWKIDVNNLSCRSLLGLLLLFLDKHDDFAKKNEEFYNSSIKKILVTINGMPHQLYKDDLGARGIYPELKKIFL